MRGFREVGWVAAVAGTALGCYMINLKVASERATLEEVENRIVLAQRDIRVLQTEIGTRGRLEQLESWNVKVLALSAPKAQQFMEGSFQLATLNAPKKTVDPAAPVVLASAPAPSAERLPADARDEAGPSARDLMQVASLKQEVANPRPVKTVDKPTAAAMPAVKPAAKAAKPLATAKSEAKAPAKTAAVTKQVTSTKTAAANLKAAALQPQSKVTKAKQ